MDRLWDVAVHGLESSDTDCCKEARKTVENISSALREGPQALENAISKACKAAEQLPDDIQIKHIRAYGWMVLWASKFVEKPTSEQEAAHMEELGYVNRTAFYQVCVRRLPGECPSPAGAFCCWYQAGVHVQQLVVEHCGGAVSHADT
jgi:hypothetical protein